MIRYRNEFEQREEWKAVHGMVEMIELLFPVYLDSNSNSVYMFAGDEVRMYAKMMNIYQKLEEVKCTNMK